MSMGISSASTPVAVPRASTLRVPGVQWDAVVAWVLTFGLVAYLALRGGGYDAVVRNDVCILVWWVVLLAAVAGLAPRLTRAGWVALGALAAWSAWTALGIGGSESAERTLTETGRLSAYAGVLLLALMVQGRAGTRHVLNGLASAMGLVVALAVLSRLHPQWFPANDQAGLLGDAQRRLSYPLNYWNGLATFSAMAAVLLTAASATARTRAGQALAGAAVPLCALVIFFSVSRAGAGLIVIGALVLLLLGSDRLALLASILVSAAASVMLIHAANASPDLRSGVDTALARSDGATLVWLCVVVCAGAGLTQVAIALVARHAERPRWLRPSRRAVGTALAVGAVAAVAVFFASGLQHQAADQFRAFKEPPALSNQPSADSVFSRLQSSAGEGRWQYWEQAMNAYRAHPLKGNGGGTFVLYWQRHATVGGAIVDAHNLYVQTLAETGLVGGALLAALLVLSVGGGVLRTVRTAGTERLLTAAATTAAVLFWLESIVDWVWQIAVLPACLFFLLAAVVGPRDPEPRPLRLPARAVVVLAAIAAFLPMAYGLSTLVKVRASQQASSQGRLGDALADARAAQAVPGTSATAVLQEALVLERGNALKPALAAAVRATETEPANWTTWLTRSRLEARLGDDAAALAHLRRARSLNPRSPIWTAS
jgi:hypothetical protein